MVDDKDIVQFSSNGLYFYFDLSPLMYDGTTLELVYDAIPQPDATIRSHNLMPTLGERWSQFLPTVATKESQLWQSARIWELIPEHIRSAVRLIYHDVRERSGNSTSLGDVRAEVFLLSSNWNVF